MPSIPINEAEADLKNYYDVVKKIKGLELKESLSIEEEELLRFHRSSKYKQRIWLYACYGYNPDDNAIEMLAFSHNKNYSKCEHNGTLYQFTPMQANAIRFMHQAGIKAIDQKDILNHIKSTQPYLRKVFQKHKAWGKLIKKVQNNIYTLDI